jgi:hypothetical protein
MNWGWQDEPEPPIAQGVIGVGAVSRTLFAAIEARPQAARQALMAAANDDLLILTGPLEDLPWVDGAQYIAPRAEMPALWLPTAQRPTAPLDLLERAIRRQHSQSPLLLLPNPAQLLPLTRLLPVEADLLRQVLHRWGLD